MIITKITGGLGNQMFQYAYGKSLSIKYNVPLILDTRFYHMNHGATKRRFQLPELNINQIDTDLSKVPNGSQILGIQDDFIYKDNYTHPGTSVYYLDGYWQSEKYFKPIQNLILDEFSPNEEQLKKLLLIPELDSNSVSMHIRRTDYVTSNGYHPVQSIEYYKQALEIIGDYDNLFIFSDDVEWCKKSLDFKNMVFVNGYTDIEEMWIQSLCKNNIIANSTFSWWGAWLNNYKDKKVIAPSKWFGTQANLNQSDIIPDEWTKI